MRTIIHGGNIYVEKGHHVSALCIEEGVITHIGTDEEILALRGEDSVVIDATGRAVVPGFNDSHQHLFGVGQALQSVLLGGVDSISKIIALGKAFIVEHEIPAGKFVIGRGWNQDYFTDEHRNLTRHDLDLISTEHPIIFTRACGHMATCNTKALEVCGITKDTPQIEGAEFYYDEDGTPNGVFTETSIAQLLNAHVPAPTVEEMTATLNVAMDYALSQGITSLQTNDVNQTNFMNMHTAYTNVYAASLARPRAYHQCFFNNPEDYNKFLAAGFKTGVGTDYNRIGPLKMFVDGSLGARTAYMRNVYADDASTQGISCMTQEQLDTMIGLADANGSQVAVHAIGDKAIEMVLDGYDKVVGDENTLRHGVVHCQITDKAMVQRFKDKDILAYVQPIFIHYDMHIVGDRVGEELASTSYAFGDMYRMGIHVSYGTDSPVEDLKPMDNLYCAVTRKDLTASPAEGYYPEQAVSLEDAISLYTSACAYVSGEEATKGKLAVGYKADLALLNRDIFAEDVETLRETLVDMTMVGGLVAYER